jgi:hypothetical protein
VSGRATAAPAFWPYPHPTLAEIAAAEQRAAEARALITAPDMSARRAMIAAAAERLKGRLNTDHGATR